MSSLSNVVPAVSIREVAAAAWRRRQDEQAERQRQEREAAEERLRDAVRNALRALTTRDDPFSPFDEADVTGARIVLEDDLIGADVLFAGEWLRYRNGLDEYGLFHVWTCPRCEEAWEPLTQSNKIGSLADLGAWLEYAPTVHRCREVAGCQYCGTPHGVSVPCPMGGAS